MNSIHATGRMPPPPIQSVASPLKLCEISHSVAVNLSTDSLAASPVWPCKQHPGNTRNKAEGNIGPICEAFRQQGTWVSVDSVGIIVTPKKKKTVS